ncbi:hypothetical protein QSU92_12315 [Microbacterium sp. ET2]|nr:hypothetical protein [Microbacterium sp. ET2 (Ac-2212)]WJL94748.1 hypothetical protein QSU92_12315 [Microbacterium sp. ET2 (Ac-2212)]
MRVLAYVAGTIIVVAVSAYLLLSHRIVEDAAREAELEEWANATR